jgi:hypothetical protein
LFCIKLSKFLEAINPHVKDCTAYCTSENIHAGISIEWYAAEDDCTLHVQQRLHRPKPSQKLSQAAGNKRKHIWMCLRLLAVNQVSVLNYFSVLKIYAVFFVSNLCCFCLYQIKISAVTEICTEYRRGYDTINLYIPNATESKIWCIN